jgi:hypothetical protein
LEREALVRLNKGKINRKLLALLYLLKKREVLYHQQ